MKVMPVKIISRFKTVCRPCIKVDKEGLLK